MRENEYMKKYKIDIGVPFHNGNIYKVMPVSKTSK